MSVAGYVLAGGNSTRMGMDKALLRNGGVALAERAAIALKQVTGKATLVGDPAKYSALGFPVIPDLRPGNGPLAGMEAALLHSGSEWNVILACDMAALDAGLIETLCDKASALPSSADCLVPVIGGTKLQPLTAIYRKRCLAAVSSALDADRRRVTDLVRALSAEFWCVSDPQPFQNVNTPEDWNRYVNGCVNELSPR